MFEKSTYINRRKKLKTKGLKGIGLFLGNVYSPMNYRDNTYHFRQDSSFLYFFGLDFPRLAAVIDFETGEDFLFGDDVDIADIIWMGPQIPLREKAANVGVEYGYPQAKLFDFISEALKKKRKVHFLPPYRGENKILLEKLTGISVHKINENASLQLIQSVIDLRSVKEDEEIVEIEKACNRV